ncbi:MAG: M28 family metallopeptidase [Candidatus Wallbacteria bacterium]|nr:M28 family metallopeptidase [Candidatus Wallbacteria bacterium]
MQKLTVFYSIFFFLSALYADNLFLYKVPSSLTDTRLKTDCPMWIELGDQTLFVGDQDMAARLPLISAPVAVNLPLYLGMSKKGTVTECLTGGKILALHDGFAVFSAPQLVIKALAITQDEHFRILPVEFGETIVAEHQGVRLKEADPRVSSLLERISEEKVMSVVKKLVNYGTRYTTALNNGQIAIEMQALFASFGLQSRVIEYSLWDTAVYNIEAVKKGTGNGNKKVLVVGHLDSISEKQMTDAPGADDNASGSAGVLAVAEALQGIELEKTVIFMLFTGEEQGLKGSEDYIRKHVVMDDIEAVLNMDMIGFCSKQPGAVLLETERLAESLVQRIATATRTYTDLVPSISYYAWGSDHEPFLKRNVPAVLIIEKDWAESPGYHTTKDTIDNLRGDYLVKLVRINLAALADLAGLQQPGF